MKKRFGLLAVWVIANAAVFAELPESAGKERQTLQKLEAAADKYPARFIEDVNTAAPLLVHLDVAQNIDVNGQAVVKLPDDVVSILHLFRGIVFGSSGGSFSVSWRNGGGIMQLSQWWGGRTGEFCYFVPEDHQSFSGEVELIINGTGTVDFIRLYEPGGISLVFDEEPWGIPAGDEPVERVSVSVDATTRLAIGGHCDFDRRKYMRIYGLADGPSDFQKAAEYFTSKGWTISRDAGCDLVAWSTKTNPAPEQLEKLRRLYSQNPGEVRCFSEWPESMAPADPALPEGTGTPAVDQFDAAAELAATVVYNRSLVLGEFAGPWCEVKNESDVAVNWAYFADKQKYDAWQLLADFHNKVADAVKRKSPDWKVGGPSSCMPSLERNSFRRGDQLLQFMDRTHDHLDYWSLHFYERNSFRLMQPAEHGHSYLFGQLEGTLDTIRNKMVLQNDVKPILITEYGGSRSPADDIGHWMLIRSINSLMMRFMQHPDCLEMSVPFVIPISFWKKHQGTPIHDAYQLFVYDNERNMRLTNLHWLLDFWSDFQGHRIVSETDDEGITVNALLDGKVVYLAANNLSQKRISTDVRGLFDGALPVAIEQTRLYIENGQLVFKKETLPGLKNIPLAFDETSIIKITLDREPEERRAMDRQIFFADKIMQPTGEETEFVISCPTHGLKNARLRISLGRENGFYSDMDVCVNDRKPMQYSLEKSRKKGMYFGTVGIPVRSSWLDPENRIRIRVPEWDGRISSVVLVNDYTFNPEGE